MALATFISGVVWSSDLPLRRKLVGEIAGPERLGAAMAIDTAVANNGTRLVGPLIGGAIYQWMGGTGIFLFCTLLYGLSLLMVFQINRRGVFPAPDSSSWLLRPLINAWQAFRFAASNREIMALLSITVVFNIWGFPMLSMVPVIGKEELGISASSIGAITALEGMAAFTGSLVMARISSPPFYRMIYYYSVCGVLVIVFLMGIFPSTITLVIGLVGFGLAGACFSIMQSTLIYLVAPAEMRGRLLGVMTICIGSGVIGFANMGIMADIFGVRYYHMHADMRQLVKLIPSTIIGIVTGVFVGDQISDEYFQLLLVIVIISGVLMTVIKVEIKERKIFSIIVGFLGGFVTMIGNAAGPIMSIYFLSMGFNKNKFIGTAAWFFLFVNLFKVPFHIFIWNTIDLEIFLFDLSLFPLILIGAIIGVWIVKKIPEKPYKIFVIVSVVLSTFNLFI